MKKQNDLNISNPAAIGAFARGDLSNFLVAATSGGIEAQEAAGQAVLVANSLLPRVMLHGCTREKLEAMGIKFGADADDIFVNVTLPLGWKKRATEHSMHSDLLDEKGRNRAGIFYKAAFYDRNAHIVLNRRYSCDAYIYCDKDGNESDYKGHTHYAVVITDSGKEIHRVGIWLDSDYKKCDELNVAAKQWLKNHFPKWEDDTAYWD